MNDRDVILWLEFCDFFGFGNRVFNTTDRIN